ncbi:DUF6350 family protein [Ruania suaedae]|uniref:cell division protein PerM n=1 Tax=Ruania suaedae TaxID=2897774 RepID=UPI001E287B66|nr:DUF6350 family protein [Ruania suaedae]UFU03875.1 DUF6350 family protein [Ruania suaedae]
MPSTRTPATADDPPRIVPRVVEHAATRPVLRIPDGALRGLLAGAEAVLLSWLVVVIPAIATYVATAAAPSLGSAGWLEAARVGTAAWLLGHGGAITVEGLELTLIPLGVTLLAVALTAGSVRRARLPGWPPAVIAAVVYVLFTVLFVVFAGVPGAARALVGAVVVAVAGVLIGLPGAALPAGARAAAAKIPDLVRLALGGAGRALGVHLLLATAAVVTAVVVQFAQVRDLHEGLHPDVVSGIVLVGAQVLVLPNLIVYAASFLLGPGFAVGEGTSFTPTGVEAGPLPVVPALGALPGPEGLAAQLPALGLVGLVAGLVLGAWSARRLRSRPVWQAAAAVGGAAVLAAAGMALLGVLASGGVGPGRMSVVGIDPLAAGLAMLWQVAASAALVVALVHERTVELARRLGQGVRSWWAEVRA